MNDQERLDYIQDGKSRVLKSILFVDPSLEEKPIRTWHPKHASFGDVASNVPKFLKDSQLYETEEEFVKWLNRVVPGDLKIIDGILNVWWREKDLINNMNQINEKA